jgi:hypothetical protein
MDYFEVKGRGYSIIRKGLGILMIITAIAWFLTYLASIKIIYLAGSIFFLLYGIYQFTNGFGFEKAWVKTENNSLIIKWNNRISPIQIHTTRISKISLERSRIIIFQRSMKPIKLNLGFLEKHEKSDLYMFFMDFAREGNIGIVRHCSTRL